MEDSCRIHGNQLSANHSLENHDYDDFDVESPVTLREIRRMRLEQETGMDLDYRCVKCRDCANCKDSGRLEAISLKEEVEMQQVDQSVKLDMENKRIICTLPLRGNERDYLTTNYDKAYKILEQLCKLHH